MLKGIRAFSAERRKMAEVEPRSAAGKGEGLPVDTGVG